MEKSNINRGKTYLQQGTLKMKKYIYTVKDCIKQIIKNLTFK